jgi:hypothetical protein
MKASGRGLHRHLKDCVRRRGAETLKNAYYDRLDDYSVGGWCAAFEARNDLARLLKKVKSGDSTQDWAAAFKLEFFHLCMFTAEGMIPVRSIDAPLYATHYQALLMSSESAGTALTPLTYLNVSTMLDGEGRNNPEKIERARNRLEQSDLSMLSSDVDMMAMAMSLDLDPGAQIGNSYLRVDLSYDNQTLREQFESWLRHARYQYKLKAEFTASQKMQKKMLTKWREYKVLEYIDLNFLAHFMGQPLSRETAARILMPEKCYSEASVRLTIESKIKSQVDPVVLEFLGSKSAS